MKVVNKIFAGLDELADIVCLGFLQDDEDFDELEKILQDAKVVPIGQAKRKKIQKLYKQAKKSPVGSGARFKALVKGGMSPKLAAWIGKKKHGSAKMKAWAAKGRKKASRRLKRAV